MPEKKISSAKRKFFQSQRNSSKEIAEKRISELFAEAEKVYDENKKLADRYVFLARKIATKYKVQFKKEQKIRFCKKCGVFLKQGDNARLRLSKGNIVIKCNSCGFIRRLKYK